MLENIVPVPNADDKIQLWKGLFPGFWLFHDSAMAM